MNKKRIPYRFCAFFVLFYQIFAYLKYLLTFVYYYLFLFTYLKIRIMELLIFAAIIFAFYQLTKHRIPYEDESPTFDEIDQQKQ